MIRMGKITGKKRHSIRKSQTGVLYSDLEREIGSSATLFQSERVEVLETNAGIVLYIIDKKPQLLQGEGWVFPTLKGLLEHPFPERKVVVDSGAVPFVVKGADVMRPGIVRVADDIIKGRPVQVVEERHSKPLAVGIALFDAAGIRNEIAGKMVKNIHYVGDDLWNLEF